MVQYTVRNRVIRIIFWINFGLTVVATLYFGWHYVADDIAGVMIAFVSFYVGGIASGQKFDKHGRARTRRPPRRRSPSTADVSGGERHTGPVQSTA